MKAKICPICKKTRYVRGNAKLEDDETKLSPCFSCLPAYNLSLKIDEYLALLKGKKIVVEGLGEEKNKLTEDFHTNESLFAAVTACLMAFESLYSAYSSHTLLLNDSPHLIKDIHEDQVKEMQGFLYDLITQTLTGLSEEGDGMKEFIEEMKRKIVGHPSFKVFAVSESGKEELLRFDCLADLPSLEPLIKEATDIARASPKWKEVLCRRGGQRTCTRADGDFLLHKLHRAMNVFRITNLALSLSLCPNSIRVYGDQEGMKGAALLDAVNKVIFKAEVPKEKTPTEP